LPETELTEGRCLVQAWTGIPMSDILRLDLEKRYRRRRLLVVDDDPVNLVFMTDVLCAAGLRVTTAADGQEAIALAATTRPQLILMDIHMPNLDGRAAAARLRSELGLKIPVIAMTAITEVAELAACRAAGMDDILPKPARPAAVYACLSKWLAVAEASWLSQ
jgi:two-component system, sensor histidine kinase and response regulator